MLNKCLGPLYVLIAQTKAGKSHRSALQKRWGGGRGELSIFRLISRVSSTVCLFLRWPVLDSALDLPEGTSSWRLPDRLCLSAMFPADCTPLLSF